MYKLWEEEFDKLIMSFSLPGASLFMFSTF